MDVSTPAQDGFWELAEGAGHNIYTNQGAASFIGEAGERAVQMVLERHGFDVIYVGGTSYDLLVNDRVTVEVKTALPTQDEERRGNGYRWQFMLYKRGDGLPLEEHALILRCQPDMLAENQDVYHFVIPGDLPGIGTLTKIDITSHPKKYRGKWKRYLERWDVLHSIVSKADAENWPNLRSSALKELPLFANQYVDMSR